MHGEQVIPDSIAGLENLEELNASSNVLESLPDSIGCLHKLKILDVSSNKLCSLPDSIAKCRYMCFLLFITKTSKSTESGIVGFFVK